MIPNYKKWGLGDGSAASLCIDKALTEEIKTGIFFANQWIDVKGFTLVENGWVDYYQGSNHISERLLFLRFVPKNKRPFLGEEHFSILCSLKNNQVFGFLKTLYVSNEVKKYLTHQEALNSAIPFIQKNNPELIPLKIVIPKIQAAAPGTKINFSQKIDLGNIELHWIGGHDETVHQDQEKHVISGMKVKMFNKQNKLWLWVVVAHNGEVIAFENNVSWNFLKGRRETQMWLHDEWLAAHHAS
jgi:hypothetical protein